MKWQKSYPYLIVSVLLLSVLLRLPALDLRPMHGDEAVNAVKFGYLLEHGTYTYDPVEYHGPTLYFFTLLSTVTQTISCFSDLDEFSLRIIPVLFGLLILVFFLLLKKDIDQPILILTLLLLAISSANVFYNRYYIHETLFVFFSTGTLISIFIYLKNKNLVALILSGLFLGMMISTKETWVIYITAIVLGLLSSVGIKKVFASLKTTAFLILLGSSVFVCILFYSSFFQNPAGILDALVSYKNYFSRAATNERHLHSWDYYISLLLFFKNSPSLFWTEGVLVLFSILGMFFVYRDKKDLSVGMTVLRFTAVYTACLIILFSCIPYKTPWNLLGFLPGMALLAAFAMVRIYRKIGKPGGRYVYSLLLSLAITHLLWQSVQLNFIYPADPLNPYVYAHPLPDVFEIEQKLKEITDHHPQGKNLHIQVIAEGNDYWPLPWYLRKYDKVGWWQRMPDAQEIAPLIILNADLEPELVHKLYFERLPGQRDLYLPLFDHDIFLRPGIEFRAYLKKDDWDLANRLEN